MKKKNYRELKENIRIMNSERSDIEKIYFSEKLKKEALMKLLNTNNLLMTV